MNTPLVDQNLILRTLLLLWSRGYADTRGVGVKAEFYTLSGKLFKFAEFEYGNDIRHEGKKIPFVSKMTIHDAIDKSKVTTLSYGTIKVIKVDPAMFNLNIRAD